MKTNYLTLLLLSTLMLFGCSDVRFSSIPGSYQDLVPIEIQGTYRFVSKDIRSKTFDSLLIEVGQMDVKLKTSEHSFVKTIHQDFQIYRIGEIFILATIDKTFSTLWNLSVIQPAKDGIRIYNINEYRTNINEPLRQERFFEPREFFFNHEPIANTPQVVETVGNAVPLQNQGMNKVKYFTPTDEQFKTYFNEELKDKEYIFLPTEKSLKRAKR